LLIATSALAYAADQKQILVDNAKDLESVLYCGNAKIRTFVAGDKFRTGLSGRVVFDSLGNGYVAAGTFVAIVTTDGRADVLTGHTDLRGHTDGPPGRASFGNALDIALVNDDLMYVVDGANFTLRRIQRRDGRWWTTTVAGVPGKRGNRDGRGRDALFTSVFDSVTVGEDGVLYLFSGPWLRKYEDGVVTTLNPDGGNGYRNGPLRSARFYHSQGAARGLACDGKGNLYVADKANIAIRKVDLRKGIVTTFAGREPGVPNAKPRDGAALHARFHGGGGPNTIVYSPQQDRFYVRSDDERFTRVIRRGTDGWVVRTLGVRWVHADGTAKVVPIGNRPCGIDNAGNLYVLGRNSIRVVRKRAAEK
jgi:internalin A